MDDRAGRATRDEVAAYEATIRRRQRRFAKFLRLRGYLGLLLMGLGALALALALLVLTVALGWFDVPGVERWTRGFDAVLAVFLPAALAGMLLRVGWSYWRHRRLEDSDTGCLVA